ncbi:MAG: sugar kinase [SAR324 cluster bacterium]|nr:sugar kinase [SAR324 cluster bacterium]MDP6728948.1 sugar kinase [SAR324 cluster bacterium]
MKLRPEKECRYDAVSLGEVMLRLDPVDVPFEKARNSRIWHGGGETNVSEGLSYCFGKKTTILTGLVDDGIGRNIENQLREAGVDTSHIIWFNTQGNGPFSTDAKGTLMNGINVTFRGKGVIPSKTEYYRAHTAVRELGPGDLDFEKLFATEGVRWAHTGGIFTLLSPKTAKLAVEFMQKAGEHGTMRSFDLNYRSKVEPDKKKAHEINRQIVAETDFLVGNQGDFSDALGYETAAEKGVPFEEWLEAYADMLRAVAKDYQNLKLIGTQLRAPLSADRISWTAVLYDTRSDQIHRATLRENIEITDRTGGGDSFASAVIAAIMEGKGYDEAVEWGAAHGILVQETPGDTTMVSKSMVLSEVTRAQKGGGVSALR